MTAAPGRPPKVWFVTGASRGLGRAWTEAALERGDQVAATARDIDSLDALAVRFPDTVHLLKLDVTDRPSVDRAVAAAVAHFGRLDVVVNNAGYGLVGAVEETTVEQARALFDTNLFGALGVTQAVLPQLRAQRAGHLLQVSSLSGVVAFPMMGLYQASKWALEGMSETLAAEVAGFGIHVTIVEPGAFRTDFAGESSEHTRADPAYAAVRASQEGHAGGYHSGHPSSSARLLFEAVDSATPPLRLMMGRSAWPVTRAAYAARIAEWEAWAERGYAAGGPD
jgi:NAD(P)-dependent dehydrogenase (short-subunit alcohol dehydrogenase family)